MASIQFLSSNTKWSESKLFCEVTYEVTFTAAESYLNFGFIPVVYVQATQASASSFSFSIGIGSLNLSIWRRGASRTQPPIYPRGQSKQVVTSLAWVPRNELFSSHEEMFSGPNCAVDARVELIRESSTCSATAKENLITGPGTLAPAPAPAPAPAVVSSTIERSTPVGGTGGNPFDAGVPSNAAQIKKLRIHAGDQINTVEVEWADAAGATVRKDHYGGAEQNAGTWADVVLDMGEYITEVSGQADSSVRTLSFKTNRGRTFGPYGKPLGTAFSNVGRVVIGFFGRGGWAIDQLGFITRS